MELLKVEINLSSESDTVEFILDRLMEALADPVCLRGPCFCFRMLDVIEQGKGTDLFSDGAGNKSVPLSMQVFPRFLGCICSTSPGSEYSFQYTVLFLTINDQNTDVIFEMILSRKQQITNDSGGGIL